MPERFTGGFVQTNAYLLEAPDGGHVLIDAPSGVARWLAEKNIRPLALLLTHQHYDHVEDAAAVAAAGVPVYAWSAFDAPLTIVDFVRAMGLPVSVPPFTVDAELAGRSSLEIGGLRMELAHVPGHSSDSVTFFLPERGELYPGDTLLSDSIGRSDLPGGNGGLLIDGIREKLFVLPESTRVHPGHGPSTTVGAERAGNPYCGL